MAVAKSYRRDDNGWYVPATAHAAGRVTKTVEPSPGLSHCRRRRAPLDREAAQVNRPLGRRVDLNEIARVVGHDSEPVVDHTVSARAIPLQVLGVARGVHELRPLGDTGRMAPADTIC